MSMRLWLPTVLGLILVALVAAYATSSRHAPAAERAAPVATDDSPNDDLSPAHERGRSLPSVPAAPAVTALAPPPPPDTAEDVAAAPAVATTPEARERDQQLERMRASGPDAGGLLGKVQAMQGDWQALAAKAGIDVQVSPLECYQAGCFSTVVFKARDAIEDLTTKILDSQGMTAWPGPKTRSAPVATPDGGAEVTWLLLPPAEASAGVAVTN